MSIKIEFVSRRFTIVGPRNWSDKETANAIETAQAILDCHASEIVAELESIDEELELEYNK